MEYQQSTAPLARHRMDSDEFTDGLAFVARRLLFSAHPLSDAERQLLHDLSRRETRYAMKTLRTLLAIAARCPAVEDQDALPEFLRGQIVAQRRIGEDAFTAFAAETEAQGLADIAQWKYARRANHITKAEVLHALRRQQAATRLSIDALLVSA